MKILLVNGAAYPVIGGVENSLRFIAREIKKLGHEVKIWCFQTDPALPLRATYEDIEIIRIPVLTSRWPHKRNTLKVKSTEQGIRQIIEEFKPDAIWSRSAPLGLGIIKSGYKGPIFQIYCTNARMDARGAYLETKGLPLKRRIMFLGFYFLHYWSFASIERKLLKNSEAVFFSSNMLTQMKDLYKKTFRKGTVIHPGVDTEIFNRQRGNELRQQIITSYPIKPESKIILYVGRLAVNKNVYLLVDFFEKVKTDSVLILVGSGPEKDRLTGYINMKHLEDKVIFAGTQDRLLPGFYAMADVTVLPTTIESFGQVYLESLACGTPAVGFKGDSKRILTATEEIVQDGMTGIVVKEISSDALADAVDEILNLPDSAYTKMSQRAINDATEKFSWTNFTTEMLALTKAKINRHEHRD